MESLEEIILIVSAIIVISLVLYFFSPVIISETAQFTNIGISQVIENSFRLTTPILVGSNYTANIYDNGYPTTLNVQINAFNPENPTIPLNGSLGKIHSVKFSNGNNLIVLPPPAANGTYYQVSLYSTNGQTLYTSFYINHYYNSYIQITNIKSFAKILINGIIINYTIFNNQTIIPLPSGSYNLTVFTPYYYTTRKFNFPTVGSEIISIPSALSNFTIHVQQLLPGNQARILSGAIVSLNDNSTTVKTDYNGNAKFLYSSIIGSNVSLSVSCPSNICGTAITNNYTSYFNNSHVASYYETNPIILYPKFRAKIYLKIINCSDIASPTPGNINIIHNPLNRLLNLYSSVNQSGLFITHLQSGEYTVSGVTLNATNQSKNNLFSSTLINVSNQNQTFDLNFSSC